MRQWPKVVFLDIDGVLNSWEWHDQQHTTASWWTDIHLDPAAVVVLNEILQRTGAVAVLSSSWRTRVLLAEMRDRLRHAGFTGLLVDRTPHGLGLGTKRGDEIAAWLQAHPEVTHYAILDDAEDMTTVRAHLVATDQQHGLRPEHIPAVLQLLE